MNGYGLLMITVLILASISALYWFIGRKIRAVHFNNDTAHKVIRHEIEVGDKKLEVRIEVLEKR
jgi:hypothetical protein